MTLIKDYTPPAKGNANAYDADIKTLIEAGEGAAWALGPIAGVHKEDGNLWEYPVTEKVKFQAAAREAGYTAKVTEERVDDKAHTVTWVFVLTDKRTRKTSEKVEGAPSEDSTDA